ncbi:MAG: hypothetical protein ACTTKL_05780 [Treponema sp.]
MTRAVVVQFNRLNGAPPAASLRVANLRENGVWGEERRFFASVAEGKDMNLLLPEGIGFVARRT